MGILLNLGTHHLTRRIKFRQRLCWCWGTRGCHTSRGGVGGARRAPRRSVLCPSSGNGGGRRVCGASPPPKHMFKNIWAIPVCPLASQGLYSWTQDGARRRTSVNAQASGSKDRRIWSLRPVLLSGAGAHPIPDPQHGVLGRGCQAPAGRAGPWSDCLCVRGRSEAEP